jgi:hypothetical protein
MNTTTESEKNASAPDVPQQKTKRTPTKEAKPTRGPVERPMFRVRGELHRQVFLDPPRNAARHGLAVG